MRDRIVHRDAVLVVNSRDLSEAGEHMANIASTLPNSSIRITKRCSQDSQCKTQVHETWLLEGMYVRLSLMMQKDCLFRDSCSSTAFPF
jgi:hypothetical protein